MQLWQLRFSIRKRIDFFVAQTIRIIQAAEQLFQYPQTDRFFCSAQNFSPYSSDGRAGFSIRKRIDFFVASESEVMTHIFGSFSIRKRIDFFVAK